MRIIKSLVVLFLAVSIMSCNCKQKQSEVVEIISMAELQQSDPSIQLIDVRTPEEYDEGYIMHAKNVNFKADNFIELMSELDKDKPVYVYCMVGGRSGKSAAQLKEAGFTKVYDYKGGFKEWEAKGKLITQNK